MALQISPHGSLNISAWKVQCSTARLLASMTLDVQWMGIYDYEILR